MFQKFSIPAQNAEEGKSLSKVDANEWLQQNPQLKFLKMETNAVPISDSALLLCTTALTLM